MKRCAKCGETKPLDGFHRDRSAPDGRVRKCKKCGRSVALAYYHANAERLNAEKRARYPERKAAESARHRLWVDRNRERVRGLNREWFHRLSPENQQAQRARVQAWKAANPERAAELRRAGVARYRARRRHQAAELVLASEVLARGDGLCGICGDPVDPQCFHVDHIVPLSRGGEHSYANTQPAHPLCNIKKGAKLVA